LRFQRRRQIALDGAPSEILAHPAEPRAFALGQEPGIVWEIDAVKLAVGRTARLSGRALSMSLAAGESPASSKPFLWILTREPDELVELPLDTLTPKRRIQLPWEPDGFTVGPDGLAAVSSYTQHSIAVASLKSAAIDRVIESRDEPSLLHFRADGAQLIAGSHPARALTIFEVASGRTVVRLPVGLAPRNFCPDTTGGQLYVTGDGMDAVVVVYPFETEIGETILAGHAPDAMAVTQGATPMLLVANPDSNRITALDPNNTGKSLVTVVDVGMDPRRILTTPDNAYALSLNRASGDISVIRQLALSKGKPFLRPTPIFTLAPVGEDPVAAAIVPWKSA
jgi:hypothetical protein